MTPDEITHGLAATQRLAAWLTGGLVVAVVVGLVLDYRARMRRWSVPAGTNTTRCNWRGLPFVGGPECYDDSEESGAK